MSTMRPVTRAAFVSAEHASRGLPVLLLVGVESTAAISGASIGDFTVSAGVKLASRISTSPTRLAGAVIEIAALKAVPVGLDAATGETHGAPPGDGLGAD